MSILDLASDIRPATSRLNVRGILAMVVTLIGILAIAIAAPYWSIMISRLRPSDIPAQPTPRTHDIAEAIMPGWVLWAWPFVAALFGAAVVVMAMDWHGLIKRGRPRIDTTGGTSMLTDAPTILLPDTTVVLPVLSDDTVVLAGIGSDDTVVLSTGPQRRQRRQRRPGRYHSRLALTRARARRRFRTYRRVVGGWTLAVSVACTMLIMLWQHMHAMAGVFGANIITSFVGILMVALGAACVSIYRTGPRGKIKRFKPDHNAFTPAERDFLQGLAPMPPAVADVRVEPDPTFLVNSSSRATLRDLKHEPRLASVLRPVAGYRG